MFGHNDEDQHNNNDNQAVTPAVDDNGFGDTSAPQLPNEPADDTVAGGAGPTIEPATSVAEDSDTLPAASDKDDLLHIKQKALEELSPLVGHLDQSPEEQFKTTMMMIQATDDANLVQKAYDAAKGIADEKVRAQALLDIVNEINYFTQQHAAKD